MVLCVFGNFGVIVCKCEGDGVILCGVFELLFVVYCVDRGW